MPSTTRRHSPTEDRRPIVEAEILTATEQLLRDGHKFTDIGVRQIVEQAGVARSSFYVSFRDKTDLLIRLAGTLKQQIFDFAKDWTPVGENGGRETLTGVYLSMIQFYRQHAELLAAINEVANYDHDVEQFWNSQLNRLTELTASLIAEEQAAGRTDSAINPTVLAQVLTWDGDRVIARHVATNDSANDAQVARELAMVRWHGAYRRPQS
jgi:AcrR family transcriptional regulator